MGLWRLLRVWCQTGWYSSPATTRRRRQLDVVSGSYDIVALKGTDGTLLWRGASADHIWPGIAIGDLNHDGRPAIVVGRSGPSVTVYNLDGSVRSGWPVTPFAGGEVRSLRSPISIATASSLSSSATRQACRRIRSMRSRRTAPIRAAGPRAHVRSRLRRRHVQRKPRDRRHGRRRLSRDLCADRHALRHDARSQPATRSARTRCTARAAADPARSSGPKSASTSTKSPIFAATRTATPSGGRTSRARRRRSRTSTVIACPSSTLPGNVYDCSTDPYTDLYYDVWLLKSDRTRWAASGYDWTVIPAQARAARRCRRTTT